MKLKTWHYTVWKRFNLDWKLKVKEHETSVMGKMCKNTTNWKYERKRKTSNGHWAAKIQWFLSLFLFAFAIQHLSVCEWGHPSCSFFVIHLSFPFISCIVRICFSTSPFSYLLFLVSSLSNSFYKPKGFITIWINSNTNVISNFPFSLSNWT